MDSGQIEQIILSGDFSQLQAAFDSLMKEINETRAGLTGLKRTSDEYKAVTQQIYKQEQDLIKVFDKADDKIDLNTKSYRELNAVLVDLRKQFKDVGDSGIRNEFIPSIQKLDKEMKTLDSSIGLHQRNVGNYEGAMRNVQMATAQVVRELPSLGMSAQTFFLAISNNIPILMDAVKNLNNLSDATGAATGKFGKFKQGLKAIGSAIFSWQTLIIAAITLLITYGDEIGNWARKVFEAKDAASEYKRTLRELNDAFEEGIGSAANKVNMVEFAETVATDETVAMDKRDQAARKLAKILKIEANETNLAAIKNGEYAESIDKVTAAILSQEKAKIALKEAEDELKAAITEQESQNQWENGKELNWWQSFRRKTAQIWYSSIVDKYYTEEDSENEFRSKKAKEATAEVERLTEKVRVLREQAKQFDLSDIFSDDDEGGSGKKTPWESKYLKQIRYYESILDAKKAADFKYTEFGFDLYNKYYDELMGHYKKDTKEFAEAQKAKTNIAVQQQERLDEMYAEMDYITQTKEDGTKEYVFAPEEAQKEILRLGQWGDEMMNSLAYLGLLTEENLDKIITAYSNRFEDIVFKYQDQYLPEAEFIRKKNDYLSTSLTLENDIDESKIREIEHSERLAQIEKERENALHSLRKRGVAGGDVPKTEANLNTVFDNKVKAENSNFFLSELSDRAQNMADQIANKLKTIQGEVLDEENKHPLQSVTRVHNRRKGAIEASMIETSSGYDKEIAEYDAILNSKETRAQLNADAILEIEKKKNDAIASKDKELSEFQKELDAENRDFKVAMAQETVDSVVNSMSAIGDIFGAIGSMYEDNEEEQKKWAIAQTVMNTAAGMAAAIASPIMNAMGIPGWIAAGIQATAVLASGIASIASIKSKDLGSVSKGGQDKVIPNEQEFLSMMPVRTMTGLSEMDELNKPIKVYVTEKDITDAQNKVKVKESETTW